MNSILNLELREIWIRNKKFFSFKTNSKFLWLYTGSLTPFSYSIFEIPVSNGKERDNMISKIIFKYESEGYTGYTCSTCFDSVSTTDLVSLFSFEIV